MMNLKGFGRKRQCLIEEISRNVTRRPEKNDEKKLQSG
jgi:hypothetical protein